MANDDNPLVTRMRHALNGPTRPNMPGVSPFMVEDAEAEIRRSVQRHYQMQAEIEELKTDRDHWRSEAQLFKAENERLTTKLKDLEAYNDELKAGLHTLHAQFETGTQIWLTGYRRLQELHHIKVIMPPALEALEHKPEEKDERDYNE